MDIKTLQYVRSVISNRIKNIRDDEDDFEKDPKILVLYELSEFLEVTIESTINSRTKVQ
jgi:hypothetical protein